MFVRPDESRSVYRDGSSLNAAITAMTCRVYWFGVADKLKSRVITAAVSQAVLRRYRSNSRYCLSVEVALRVFPHLEAAAS